MKQGNSVKFRPLFALLHPTVVAFVLVGLLCVGLLSTALSSRAYATTPTLDCTGSISQTYSPGVTDTPKTVHLTATVVLAPCVAPTDPTLTAGSFSGEGDVTLSCLQVLSLTGTRQIHWNNGESSVVTVTTQETVNLPTGETQAVGQGSVTSGFGTGDIYVATTTYLTSDLTACETEQGLTTLGGILTVQFL